MNKNIELKYTLIACLLLILLLPLGLSGLVTSSVFKLICLLHVILLIFICLLCSKKLLQIITESPIFYGLLAMGSLLICLYFCITGLILPVTARDALIHHLAVPKIWIQSQLIHQISWHEWSFYPMLIQLAFTGILQAGTEQLSPEQLCSFYVFLYLPIFIYSLTCLSEKISDSKYCVIFTVIIGFSLPCLLKLASVPMVDLPLALFCTIALIFLYDLSTEKSAKAIIFSGLAVGLALSTKLNAIPFVIFSLLAFLAVSREKKGSLKPELIALSKVSLIALVVFSVWLIKNYIWTANPLYPYANSLFGSQLLRPDSGLQGLNPLQQRLMLYGESLWQVLFLPVRLFFEGRDDNPQFFDGVLSPLLFIGLLFSLLAVQQKKIRILTFVVLAVIIFSLLSTGARIRYLAPVYSSLVVLTACALSTLRNAASFTNPAIKAALVVQLLFGAIYVLRQSESGLASQYLRGSLSKNDYLSLKIPEFPVIDYCNNNLPKNSKIYLIYTGNQFYLYDQQIFSSGHTSADHLLSWLRESSDGKLLAAKFAEKKITHLLIKEDRLYHILSSALNKQQKDTWNEFFNRYLLPNYSERGFSLYELKLNKNDDLL